MKSHLKRRNKSLGSVEAAVEDADKPAVTTAALMCQRRHRDVVADLRAPSRARPSLPSNFPPSPHPAYLHEPVARLADEGEAH